MSFNIYYVLKFLGKEAVKERKNSYLFTFAFVSRLLDRKLYFSF